MKKGKCIYIYTSAHNENFYGKPWYSKIIKEFPKIRVILATNPRAMKRAIDMGVFFNSRIRAYPQDKMKSIYAQCFLGIRLTRHDGISATVQEMGLMGIPTITNGNTPACINYKTYKDIVSIIKSEQKKIGTIDKELSKKTNEHLNLCDIHIKKLFVPVTINGQAFFLLFDGSYPKDFKCKTRPSDKTEPVQTLTKQDKWVIYEKPDIILYENTSGALYPPSTQWVRVAST